MKLREVPVSEFEEYKSFRKALEDEQNRYVVLISQDSSSRLESEATFNNPVWTLPDSDNADAMRAESQVQARMQLHDMPGTISALKRAVAADPRFTRAWALLGQFYLASGKPEEGVDAFRKAVNSDPKSPIPLKMLAFSLNGAHRTDEAIKTWQELLELTPEDHDAAATLGNLLISQKRFKEAIPLLEASAKKSPDNPALQMSLGNAYLLTGDPEKGMSVS